MRLPVQLRNRFNYVWLILKLFKLNKLRTFQYYELIGIFIKQLLENNWFSNFIAYIFVHIEQIGGLLL